jgi:hypothetical protein
MPDISLRHVEHGTRLYYDGHYDFSARLAWLKASKPSV